MAPKKKSSARWLQRNWRDPYVKKARRDGYRSRAAYKLMEIDRRDRILDQGGIVIDLGAAPGGWSQLAMERVGPAGRVIAVDLLPIVPIRGVELIQGDFRDNAVVKAVTNSLDGAQATLVLSDMAPNISGVSEIDQPRAMYLAELALDLTHKVCAPRGALLVKVFEGEGLSDFRQELQGCFGRVCTRKPQSSRARSRESYLLALNYGV